MFDANIQKSDLTEKSGLLASLEEYKDFAIRPLAATFSCVANQAAPIDGAKCWVLPKTPPRTPRGPPFLWLFCVLRWATPSG